VVLDILNSKVHPKITIVLSFVPTPISFVELKRWYFEKCPKVRAVFGPYCSSLHGRNQISVLMFHRRQKFIQAWN